MRRRNVSRSMLVGLVVAATLLAGAPAWSKGGRAKDGAQALWIAADRVVGFVPFSVTLYGRVMGTVEPGRLDVCREAVMQADFGNPRGAGDDPMAGPGDRVNAPAAPGDSSCAAGTLVRGRDGFDFRHEMRFDRPGTYRVRLSTVDASGHRAISNTVQVNAL